jgi:putative peptide zinc metalloprotease protein
VPRLAAGIELIGRMEGSGYKDPPYIARREDGQVIQLPALLYAIAEQVDGRRGYGEIAERASEVVKRGLSGENAKFLIDEKLAPLGLLERADDAPELEKNDPLLALKFRAALVPERLVSAITTLFRPLFLPPVILAVLAGLLALDYWVFFVHGVAGSMRSVLYHPVYVLAILGLVVLSAAFHECGHATACAYGGAKPGVMGAGIYIVWPAFYTDVTDAYRLGKGGRLRTDLGGVYFNTIFILATAGAYFATGFAPLLLIIPLQHLEIVHQFLPFIRLDGYYIVSDLVGVPDMFSRIKPTLKSLVPWLPAEDSVEELKPWVRVATTVYVLTVVPLLLFLFAMMVINLPRILSTAWDSFFVQLHKIEHTSSTLTIAFSAFQLVVLCLPVLGLAVTFWRLGARVGVGGWRATRGKPVLRTAFVTGLCAAAAAAAYVWAPSSVYRPIQPGEKGTLSGGFDQLAAVETGRPGLTPARAKQLNGAPSLSRQTPGTKPGPVPAATTGTTRTTSTVATTDQTTTASSPAATTTDATATTATTTDTTTTATTTDTTTTATTTTVTTP